MNKLYCDSLGICRFHIAEKQVRKIKAYFLHNVTIMEFAICIHSKIGSKWIAPDQVIFFLKKGVDKRVEFFFLFFQENICCWYSL